MAAYATPEDLTAHFAAEDVPTPPTGAPLNRLLDRASRDVDAVLGPLPTITTGDYAGFKVDPTSLLDWERAALARATCVQAEHRFRYLEPAQAAAAAGEQSVKSIEGPDFKKTYGDAIPTPTVAGSGRFDPRLPAELAPLRRLRRLSGRAVA